ncbi:MAG: hypothetical protein AAB426_04455 [Myxococcota bacterium]
MSATSVDSLEVRRFVHEIAAVPELAMRGPRLAERLQMLGGVSGAYHLEALIRGALAKDPTCAIIYRSLVDPAKTMAALGGDWLDDVFAAARDLGAVAASQWILSPQLAWEPDACDQDRLVHKALRELTLGERRAHARRATGELLRQLLGDPDPSVVENLLRNPRTTESEALVVCARRPTVTEALEVVLVVERWARRYRIQLALARNPHLRPTIAVNLLPLLKRRDLLTIAADATLGAPVQQAAATLAALPMSADWAAWMD